MKVPFANASVPRRWSDVPPPDSEKEKTMLTCSLGAKPLPVAVTCVLEPATTAAGLSLSCAVTTGVGVAVEVTVAVGIGVGVGDGGGTGGPLRKGWNRTQGNTLELRQSTIVAAMAPALDVFHQLFVASTWY